MCGIEVLRFYTDESSMLMELVFDMDLVQNVSLISLFKLLDLSYKVKSIDE
jgi:hypothetical protein